MKLSILIRRVEDTALVFALMGAVLFPSINAIGRAFGGGFYIPGEDIYLQQFVLWLAFVGGLVATREKKHLVLSTAEFLKGSRVESFFRFFTSSLAAVALGILAYASVLLVNVNQVEAKFFTIGIPVWLSECIMPLTLALMAIRFAGQSSKKWKWKILSVLIVGIVFAGGYFPDQVASIQWPLFIIILAGFIFGAPVFAVMTAIAILFFFVDETPVSAVSAEVYRLINSPTLPAIPLLTAAGYILAESQASRRLLRFFRASLGWLPGGLAVMVVAVCAMFTSFTGGSGVTILALGGLVYPILIEDGYPKGFSLGLITASCSLGLLFPPSLPVILYSVVASTSKYSVPAGQMYIAGFIPGILTVVAVSVFAMFVGYKIKTSRQRFSLKEFLKATWNAKWEIGLPILVIGLFATGFTSMIETAAAAVIYAVIVECFITKDIRFFHDLPSVLVKSSILTGAVLILISAVMGVTSYMVDAMIPDMISQWVIQNIHNPFLFLLALNGLLLLVGCLVDIYSAIIILAPLIAPLGAAFLINPIHLGVIFLVNLELGFLTPPIGINLFLVSSRFDVPLMKVYRYTLPFLLINALMVLLITYFPFLSVGVLHWLGLG